jgi:hypothetical protein
MTTIDNLTLGSYTLNGFFEAARRTRTPLMIVQLMEPFTVGEIKEDYAIVTLNVGGIADIDEVLVHPYGSSIAYRIYDGE